MRPLGRAGRVAALLNCHTPHDSNFQEPRVFKPRALSAHSSRAATVQPRRGRNSSATSPGLHWAPFRTPAGPVQPAQLVQLTIVAIRRTLHAPSNGQLRGRLDLPPERLLREGAAGVCAASSASGLGRWRAAGKAGTPTAARTRSVSAALVHLPWPRVFFECTRAPFNLT